MQKIFTLIINVNISGSIKKDISRYTYLKYNKKENILRNNFKPRKNILKNY